jgi:hypothetical protein
MRSLPEAGVRAANSMPHYLVPIEHFGAAFAWLAVAIVCLNRIVPSLAAGAYSDPQVIATAHALTLGLVLTTIIGALQQISPVAMGVPARRESLVHLAFALLVVGTFCVVTGAWNWWPTLLAAGWSCIVIAVTVTWWNLVRLLRDAPRAPDPALAVRVGFACLAAALAISFTRIGNALGWWSVSSHALLVAHVHLALGGFATVIAMGIGSHVLPMILTTKDAPRRLGHIAWRAIAAGSVTVATGALTDLGAVAMAVGVATWLVFVAFCFARRGNRPLDRAVAFVGAAHLLLAAACVAGLVALFVDRPTIAAAYGTFALFGWLTLFITGVAGRILPMLVLARRVAHRKPLRGKESAVGTLLAQGAALGLVLGAAGLPVAIALRSQSSARMAALSASTGVVLLLVQHCWLAIEQVRGSSK